MTTSTRTCPGCDGPVRTVWVPTRVKRAERVLTVPLESWQCERACRAEDGAGAFVFSDQTQAARNEARVRASWREAFGSEMPEARRPGRKPAEPRSCTVQVKLTERELRELDERRGATTRSEYLRAHALAPLRRTG